MDYMEFKEELDDCRLDTMEEDIDKLCIKRLEHSCQEFGNEGKTALKLLDVVKDLLELR